MKQKEYEMKKKLLLGLMFLGIFAVLSVVYAKGF